MSYEEKGTWVYLVVSISTYAWYVAVILGRAADTSVTEVAYISTMLWAIGIAIALSVIGRTVVEIAKPSENHQSDARDRDIYRFGEYVGGTVLAVGMVAPFGLTLAKFEYFWIANAIYAVFVLSAVVGTTIKLIAYRRGL